MKQLKIKVHSVVDVITNSSTVIYTQADGGTISAIKEMVNSLLSIGGSTLTADDLFEFELYCENELEFKEGALLENSIEYSNKLEELRAPIIEKYGALYSWKTEFHGDKEEFDKEKKILDDTIGALTKEYFKIHADEEWMQWETDYDEYNDVDLLVSVKVDDERAKIAGKILNRLDDLFNHEARYDG